MTQQSSPPAGWYPAPHAENELRYWDGIQWSAAPQPPAFRPLRRLSWAIGALVCVTALISIAAVVIDIWGLIAINGLLDGRTQIEELEAYDLANLVVAVSSIPVMVAAGVCWWVWQYRAAVRVRATVAGGVRREPAWHVVSWIIPLVLLWFPFQNQKDLARASGAAISTSLLGIWWALWIVSTAVTRASGPLMNVADTVPDISAVIGVVIFGEVLLIAAAPLAWLIVRRTTDALEPR